MVRIYICQGEDCGPAGLELVFEETWVRQIAPSEGVLVMLTLGNVYGHGFDSGQIATLEALGFALRPGASSYAGSQLCRFLDFENGRSLELIEVTDRSDYESVRLGINPLSWDLWVTT